MFFPIELDEVLSDIRRLKVNGSCSGLDIISAKILKATSPFFVEHLNYFFNLFISSDCFSPRLKVAKVIPVHKKDTTDDIAHYRLFSSDQITKIFEKLVHKRMCKFLVKFSILSDR